MSTSEFSRREFVGITAGAAALGFVRAPRQERPLPPYGNGTIPAGIRPRLVTNVNGLTVHILEAWFETPGRPAVPRST